MVINSVRSTLNLWAALMVPAAAGLLALTNNKSTPDSLGANVLVAAIPFLLSWLAANPGAGTPTRVVACTANLIGIVGFARIAILTWTELFAIFPLIPLIASAVALCTWNAVAALMR